MTGTVTHHRPWPRRMADAPGWERAAARLAAGEGTLLALWGEPDCAHMAILDEGAASPGIEVLSLACPDGRFPSVGRVHAPAIRLERAMRDLFGLEPVGLPDARPWPDHGRWGVAAPLSASPRPAPDEAPAYPFLPVEGEDLHEVPVGPVHAGIIEPGHFRFTCDGETVVRLEERLGYVHKGIEGLMRGAELDRAARLAARTSGDSTVAYGIAFARAAEAALGIEPPPRAVWLRALMAELERLANHLGDVGAICNDASFALMHAHCGILRERVLRAAMTCFGHRLMMDRVVPGGVACNLDAAGIAALRALVAEIGARFPRLADLYDRTASLLDRTVATGIVRPDLARRFGAGGHVGRASGRAFDSRRALGGYPPYDALRFEVPVLEEGDVNARVWIRIREIGQSLALVAQILDRLPDGPVRVPVAPARGEVREGMALAEAFRGEVFAWLRLDAGGRVARCHLRDPSWFQWPLLEAAIEDNIIADFPLCNKSFNCSYSGHDL
ncbi:hydrogenase expression protein HypE [Caldovatus sediminis]|uniref:Hydrogenase expression protein HypE n=1 Tax=Caldovatus sediminis TaxID=2041189 RepID=A0A8J2Z891_9PROT|nr:hydrogenase expression protein HypE [Caldovatus sediminis]GGG18441.1 hydrogenase expression protein HypE [Caldovatus sediminis]